MKINPGQLPELKEALWGQLQAAVLKREHEIGQRILNAIRPIEAADTIISAELRKLEEKILALPEEVRAEIEKALVAESQPTAAIIDPEALIRRRIEEAARLIRTEPACDNEAMARRIEADYQIRTSARQIQAIKAALTKASKHPPAAATMEFARAAGSVARSALEQELRRQRSEEVNKLLDAGEEDVHEIARRVAAMRIPTTWHQVSAIKARRNHRLAASPPARPLRMRRVREDRVPQPRKARKGLSVAERDARRQEQEKLYAAIKKIVGRGVHDTPGIKKALASREFGFTNVSGRVINGVRSSLLGVGIHARGRKA